MEAYQLNLTKVKLQIEYKNKSMSHSAPVLNNYLMASLCCAYTPINGFNLLNRGLIAR